MTPQQHKQHLLALADRLENENVEAVQIEAANELRSIAARLTPGVSDAMVKRAYEAYDAVYRKLPMSYDHKEIDYPCLRAAIEAVFPLVDDGQAKDAARYRILWHSLSGMPGCTTFDMPRISMPFPNDGTRTYTPQGLNETLDEIAAAMAAPPKDITP